MADNLDDVFGAEHQAEMEAQPVEAPIAPEQAPATVEAPADAVVEAVDLQPQEAPETPADEEKQGRNVPLDAYLSEREKRQEEARLRQAAEARIAQYEAQQQRPQTPDPYDNPEGYAAHIRAEFQGQLQQQKVDTSWTLAVRDYGQEAAEAARTWATEKARTDPIFGQQLDVAFQTETLPIDWLVQQHKRDALLSDIGDPSKLDDWFAKEAAKRGYMQSAPTVAAVVAVEPKQALPPAKVPRSLASQGTVPSDIRHTASGPLAGVDALFS